MRFVFCLCFAISSFSMISVILVADDQTSPDQPSRPLSSTQADVVTDEEFEAYGIYGKTAPQPITVEAERTTIPLRLDRGTRIAFIGNTLLERSQHFGYLETLIHQTFPEHELVIRNLAWPADTPRLQPRPDNFADIHQHLTHLKTDLVFVAFGFNESFNGNEGLEQFGIDLTHFVQDLQSNGYNGKQGARVVLLTPTANENVDGIQAAGLNNHRIRAYAAKVMHVAEQCGVAAVDLFPATLSAMQSPNSDLTINGCHLNDDGYRLVANTIVNQVFEAFPGAPNERIRATVVDKNRQFFRRYRPANTFYYTGGRRKAYGYLDFLPAMRNFDIMTSNRDRRIWDLAQGKQVPEVVDDSNLPPLPKTKQARSANRWITAADELAEFKIDPRFEVNLFAGEEQFSDIGAPIQMRWDNRGRLWVSCSTTYPHVYPGNEPNDKIVILEDTDNDGRADKSTVFADDLHIPLSFEFGDGGLYVSEMPHLTFIKDTDGDGKADYRRRLLTGFGTEDSHHALHDMTWTPDGDLIFREGIFHHTQVETAYGPVRQQNSGWFRFQPRTQRLTGFGTYHSTNPWGVTFDEWGQHVASHPIYAAAFHATDPPYPKQHPRAAGLQAYSGTCGQEFVDFKTFPDELQGGFIKARYKPTNRIEIHKWHERTFGYEEEYVSDVIFSSNLSFIPVDIRFGPRGALYVCDWYNPVKGHAQYSLRDDRRDRHSGRIWRITTKGKSLQDPPRFADASISQLLETLRRPEYRYRYWAKRELRSRNPYEVKRSLDRWSTQLDPKNARHRHNQLEAIWTYRWIGHTNIELLRELLICENHHARAAATQQLRYWHESMPDAVRLLRSAANDANAVVRMEAIIAASYIGTKAALDAAMHVLNHPHDKHLSYAIASSLGSASLRRHWEGDSSYKIASLLKSAAKADELREPTPSGKEAQFDGQKNLKRVDVSCMPERMLFTTTQFIVRPGQPTKLVFTNPDATDHNLLIIKPNALEEVGMAANAMAKDPKFANSDFIPKSKASVILHAAPMIGPTRRSRVHVLRFEAPKQSGIYPYLCTFPGHWVVMRGEMVVAETDAMAQQLLAAREPEVRFDWKASDFADVKVPNDERSVMRGMQSFMKARCNQCHSVAGHGENVGADISQIGKKYQGDLLLQHILDPSREIAPEYRNHQIVTAQGQVYSGMIVKQTEEEIVLLPNLLTPTNTVTIQRDSIESQTPSRTSSMPVGPTERLGSKRSRRPAFVLAIRLRAAIALEAPALVAANIHPHWERLCPTHVRLMSETSTRVSRLQPCHLPNPGEFGNAIELLGEPPFSGVVEHMSAFQP